jgi:hypothetical protein
MRFAHGIIFSIFLIFLAIRATRAVVLTCVPFTIRTITTLLTKGFAVVLIGVVGTAHVSTAFILCCYLLEVSGEVLVVAYQPLSPHNVMSFCRAFAHVVLVFGTKQPPHTQID